MSTVEAPAAYRRRTSTYVLAFTPRQGWTTTDLTDELVATAGAFGWVLAGAYPDGPNACIVARFPNDHAAVKAAEELSAETLTLVAGIVTGLGVHRRKVQ